MKKNEKLKTPNYFQGANGKLNIFFLIIIHENTLRIHRKLFLSILYVYPIKRYIKIKSQPSSKSMWIIFFRGQTPSPVRFRNRHKNPSNCLEPCQWLRDISQLNPHSFKGEQQGMGPL